MLIKHPKLEDRAIESNGIWEYYIINQWSKLKHSSGMFGWCWLSLSTKTVLSLWFKIPYPYCIAKTIEWELYRISLDDVDKIIRNYSSYLSIIPNGDRMYYRKNWELKRKYYWIWRIRITNWFIHK